MVEVLYEHECWSQCVIGVLYEHECWAQCMKGVLYDGETSVTKSGVLENYGRFLDGFWVWYYFVTID